MGARGGAGESESSLPVLELLIKFSARANVQLDSSITQYPSNLR